MKALFLGIAAVYILAACDNEKKSPTPPAAPSASAEQKAGTNPLKAPIDRTRNVLDQVKKEKAGEQP